MLGMPRKPLQKQSEAWATLGSALAHARTYAGLSQAEASTAIGIGRETLISIERGERQVRADELRAMSELYSIVAPDQPADLCATIDTMHPDDIAAITQIAAILRADRLHRERLEERRIRLAQQG